MSKAKKLLCILSAVSAVIADSAQPVQQPWSKTTYGPDGPWNAIQVQVRTVNTSLQTIDLAVGGYFQSIFLSDQYCLNHTLFGSNPCNSANGVTSPSLQNMDIADSIPAYKPPAVWGSPSPGIANGLLSQIIPFDVQVPVDYPPIVTNLSVQLVNSSWLTLPDGTVYPHTLGFFSLGAPAYNQSFPIGDGIPPYNDSLFAPSLFRSGKIPSASVSLQIGSASLGIPGSMYYGGYDQNRVVGDILSQKVLNSGQKERYLEASLLDIGIGTATGQSPFNFTSKAGLLAQGNTAIASGGTPPGSILIEPVPNNPYMYLPQSTCDAIASNLPVTYSPKYNLYLWNVNDPNYGRIIGSASYLSFIFSSNSKNVTIKVPWALLHLTLEAPIIGTPTPYFPCQPSSAGSPAGQYTLGQAFLQAAFMAIDWLPDAPPGYWFMAQAPGPGVARIPNVVPISNGTSSLTASIVKWEDTWTGHWAASSTTNGGDATGTAAASSGQASSGSSGDSGLSAGAKAGIGVGVGIAGLLAVAALAFFLIRRRRKQDNVSVTAFQSVSSPIEKSSTTPAIPAPKHYSVPVSEVPNEPAPVFELSNGRFTPELSGYH